MEISNALVDLGLLPIQDIPQLPRLAQEVLAGVLLESLREAQASGTSPRPLFLPFGAAAMYKLHMYSSAM
jgi:hypothetical protein